MGSSNSVLNTAGGFQRLQESDHVIDFRIVKKSVTAPGRHDGVRVVDARIINVVEQPLVLAASIANSERSGATLPGRLAPPAGPIT